jgi:isoprenylcysteine carboxyl methyltransferase (ICMT) family protein YpbQ
MAVIFSEHADAVGIGVLVVLMAVMVLVYAVASLSERWKSRR